MSLPYPDSSFDGVVTDPPYYDNIPYADLTVEVARCANAALVYSLTWSAREAMGNVALLEEIDHLASRVDQLREPVSQDEILPVLQRRLLAAPPEADAADRAAEVYARLITQMRAANAGSASERQQVEAEGLRLRQRIRSAYPFHPALIDIMRERWSSLDAFQRTRGALRFLATCLHAVKKARTSTGLLGPGDVPLEDRQVVERLIKELGLLNRYDPVLQADLVGPIRPASICTMTVSGSRSRPSRTSRSWSRTPSRRSRARSSMPAGRARCASASRTCLSRGWAGAMRFMSGRPRRTKYRTSSRSS